MKFVKSAEIHDLLLRRYLSAHFAAVGDEVRIDGFEAAFAHFSGYLAPVVAGVHHGVG